MRQWKLLNSILFYLWPQYFLSLCLYFVHHSVLFVSVVLVENALNFFIYGGKLVEVVYYLSSQSLLYIFSLLVPLSKTIRQENLFFFPLLKNLVEVTHEMQI